jgi:hypothetical protein
LGTYAPNHILEKNCVRVVDFFFRLICNKNTLFEYSRAELVKVEAESKPITSDELPYIHHYQKKSLFMRLKILKIKVQSIIFHENIFENVE